MPLGRLTQPPFKKGGRFAPAGAPRRYRRTPHRAYPGETPGTGARGNHARSFPCMGDSSAAVAIADRQAHRQTIRNVSSPKCRSLGGPVRPLGYPTVTLPHIR